MVIILHTYLPMIIILHTYLPMIIILHTYLPMKMEQSVPKHRHTKFRRRGITQKKTYNIHNTAKV
jgi:hypothetical protein